MQTVSMPDFTAMTSEGRVRPEKRVPNQRRDYFDPIMNQSKREPNNAEFTVTDAEMDRRRQARNDTLYEDTVTLLGHHNLLCIASQNHSVQKFGCKKEVK